jgi:hypothetical protein
MLMVSTPVLLIAYGASPSVAGAAVALVLLGGTYIACLNTSFATIQQDAPQAYRGRILSLGFCTVGVTFPITLVLLGPLADQIGLTAMTVALGLVGLVVMLIGALRPGAAVTRLEAADHHGLEGSVPPVEV